MVEESGNTHPTGELAAMGDRASEPTATPQPVGFEHLHRVDELMQEYLIADEEPTIPTGFLSLDKWLMGGLRRKMIYVIAGRPGEGKSSLALSMARRMVIEVPVRVIYLSLEMTKRELIERLICQATLKPIAHLNQLRTEGNLAETLRMTVKDLAGKWLHLEDARGATIEDLEAFWEQLREAGGETPDVLIIDHLQQIPMVFGISRADAISNYMSDLKRFVKQKNVAVILCCQINRQGTEKPGLLNLKGSGGIEEVADVVLIGHRPSFDSAKTTEDLSADMDYDLYICKQRRGPEYKINLLFRAPCFEFLEPTGYGAPRHPALETRVIGRDETPF